MVNKNRRLNLKKIINKNNSQLLIIFIIQGLNAILGFFIQITLSNEMSVEGYGKFNVIFNSITILTLLVCLGNTNFILRNTSIYRKNLKKTSHLINNVIIYSILNWSLVFLILLFVNNFLLINTNNYIDFSILLYGCIWLLFSSFTLIFQNFDRALGFTLRSMLPATIFKSIILLSLIVIVGYYSDNFQTKSTVLIYAFTFLITTTMFLIYDRAYLSLNFSFLNLINNYKKTFLGSFQYFFNKVALNLLKNSDIIMIGFILTDFEAGIYGAATRINIIVIFGLSSMNILYSPMVAKLFKEDKIQDLNRNLKTPNLIIFLFALTLLIFILIFGKVILSLFGNEYVGAYLILVFLSFRNLVQAVFGINGSILNMTNNQKYFNKILYLILFFYIVTSPFIIKYFGIESFAGFVCFIALLRNFLQWHFLYYKLNIKCGIFSNVLEKLNVL